MGVNKVAPTFSQSSSFTIVDKHIREVVMRQMRELEERLTNSKMLSSQLDEVMQTIGEYIEGTPIIHYLVEQNLKLAARVDALEGKAGSRPPTPAISTGIEDDRRARIKEKIRNG